MSSLAAQQTERPEPDDYVRLMGAFPTTTINAPDPMSAARATAQACDMIMAPLTRKIEQNERAARELGIVREDRAREQAIIAEAEEADGAAIRHVPGVGLVGNPYVCEADESPESNRDAVFDLTVFDTKASLGLIAELDAALREDGCVTGIGVRRSSTSGYITGLVITYRRRDREGGR